jgi:hypothetical protein
MEYLKWAYELNKENLIDSDIKIEFTNSSILLINGDNIKFKLNILNYILVSDNDFQSKHLERIINSNIINFDNKIDEQNSYKIFNIILKKLPTIYGFCTICGDSIKNINKITTCGLPECKSKEMLIVTGNTIFDSNNNDTQVFNFLVKTGYACLMHPHMKDIFKPYPSFLDKATAKSDLKYNFKTIDDLYLYLKLEECNTDFDIYFKIGELDYGFIKFLLETNTTIMGSDTLFDDSNKNIFQEKKNDIIVLQVRHDPITSAKFNSNLSNPEYLFHGSSFPNWYSILRNGLKVYSGTNLMSTGAAYGAGIYLGGTASTSYHYGVDKYCSSNLIALGVVQVLQEKINYKKAADIYVVPNENEVLLKYIIIIKKNHKDLDTITNFFTKIRTDEIVRSNTQCMIIKTKRMNKEFIKLDECKNKYHFEISEEPSIFNIKYKNCIIAIYFPDEYPLNPPFIWLKQQGNNINTNKMAILNFGGIVLNELTYDKWSSLTKIYKLIKNILKNVSDDIIDIKIHIFEDAFKEYTNKMFKKN